MLQIAITYSRIFHSVFWFVCCKLVVPGPFIESITFFANVDSQIQYSNTLIKINQKDNRVYNNLNDFDVKNSHEIQ